MLYLLFHFFKKKKKVDLLFCGILFVISQVGFTQNISDFDHALNAIDDTEIGMKEVSAMAELYSKMQKGSRASVKEVKNLIPGSLMYLKALSKRLSMNAKRENPLVSEDKAIEFSKLVVQFFKFSSTLYSAHEFLGRESILIDDDLKDLRIVLDTPVAEKILTRILAAEASESTNDIFVGKIEIRKFDSNRSSLQLPLSEVQKLGYEGFLLNPSNEGFLKWLFVEARKISFPKKEFINSYLYSNTKVPNVDEKQLSELSREMQSNAKAIYDEILFRKRISSELVGNLNVELDHFYESNVEQYHSDFVVFADNLMTVFTGRVKPGVRPLVGQLALLAIENEMGNRLSEVKKKIEMTPLYMGGLSAEKLRPVVRELYLDYYRDLLRKVFNTFVFTDKLENFTFEEQVTYSVLIEDFIQKYSFPESVLAVKKLQEIINSSRNPDIYVSYKRYDLAKKLIWASKEIAAFEIEKSTLFHFMDEHEVDLEKMNPSESAEIAPAHRLPLNRVPKKYDVATLMLSVFNSKEFPSWYFDVVKSKASKVNLLPNEERQKLKSIVLGVPSQVKQQVSLLKSLLSDSVLKELVAAQKASSGDSSYNWGGSIRRIEVLKGQKLSDKAKKALSTIHLLLKAAEVTGSQELTALVNAVQTEILSENTFSTAVITGKHALEKLTTETDLANDYVHSSKGREFIEGVFGPANVREQFLRQKLLTDPRIYKRYLDNKINELKNMFPLAFTAILIPKEFINEAQSSQEKPLPLYQFVNQLLASLSRTGASYLLGKTLVDQIDSDALNKVEQDLASMLSPEKLAIISLRNAAESASKSDFEKLIDHAEKRASGTEESYLSKKGEWPTQFKVRDVLPALTDSAPGIDEKEKTPSLKTRTERLIVSLFLQPYLLAAAHSTNDEILRLENPTTENVRMLLKSQAYSELMGISGDLLNSGVSGLEKEYLQKSLPFLGTYDQIKGYTTVLQNYNHIMFPLTMVMQLNRMGHTVVGLFMGFAIASDYAADALLLSQYYSLYSAVKPFSNSGILGKGLISQKQAEDSKRRFDDATYGLAMRSIIDLPFGYSIFMHNAWGNFGLAKYKTREVLGSKSVQRKAAELKEDYQEYKKDLKEYSEVLDRMNMISNPQKLVGPFISNGTPEVIGPWMTKAQIEKSLKDQLAIIAQARKDFTNPKLKHKFDRIWEMQHPDGVRRIRELLKKEKLDLSVGDFTTYELSDLASNPRWNSLSKKINAIMEEYNINFVQAEQQLRQQHAIALKSRLHFYEKWDALIEFQVKKKLLPPGDYTVFEQDISVKEIPKKSKTGDRSAPQLPQKSSVISPKKPGKAK